MRCSRLLFPVLALSMVPISLAQTATTALSGVVTDPSGAILGGVDVQLTEGSIGFSQVHRTNASGEYSFQQIPPGNYEIRISAAGFETRVTQAVLLVNQPGAVNIAMAVGGQSTIIEVTAQANAINVTDATLGNAFNTAQVENLPYLANNVTYLLSLQPGVLALDSGAQSGGLNTDTRTGIVNGARQDQSNLTLDGVDNNDQIFGYAFNGALRSTRESVDEFRVTTTNANADAGRASGAQVSLVTKSGTNTIHGSAYEYYRDPATTSNNWFIKQGQLNSGQPNVAAKVLQHTYGASLGFPIKKDKLYFFGAYEGFKQASDIPVGEVVPSTLGGGGLITGNVTYEACPTSAPCKNGTTLKTLTPTDIAQLDGRKSDAACATGNCYAPATDAASIAYFKQFPLANAPGGDGYNTGSFNFTSPAPINQITNIARVDYNLNSKQTLFVRGNLQSDNLATALQFPGLPAASEIFGNNKGIAVGHVWSINDHVTNNIRYGLTRLGSATRGTGSQPYTNFLVFNPLTATTTSNIYAITTNNVADDFSYTKGRHTIQGGTNLYFLSNGQYFDAPEIPVANVSPNLLATAAIANQGGSLDPGAFHCADCATVSSSGSDNYNSAIIANVGAIETATSGTEFKVQNNALVPLGAGVIPTHTFRNIEQEYYIQDQWKATPQLTLTYGIRYVYLGVPYEKDGQQIAPTIPLNTFLANRAGAAATGQAYTAPISFRASGSANGQPNFWTPQKLNFAPRLAFAYATKDNRTSVRGGFAMAYDHFGAGVIDSYQSNTQSLFSLSQTNLSTFTDINSNPRFTGFRDVPAVSGNGGSSLPYTPADSAFTFDYSINDQQKTPYAETFNLTVQHQLPHNLDLTASYVGRLGRHLIQNVDVAAPTNFVDGGSGQTYFQAATNYDKMVDAGVDPSTVPDSGYFHNVFPNFTFGGYRGAQAYYAYFAANRGNETNALFAADTDPTASAGGQSFRFFFPQTSSIYVQSTTGVSSYNALQLSLHQALRHGLDYGLNYTYAKSLDEGSDPERDGIAGSVVVNTFSPHQLYADSDFDVRHNITAYYTAPLPLGKGQQFLNKGGLVDLLFGGFQLNGEVHYSTGFPYSAVANGNWGTNFAFNSNLVQTGPIPTGGHHYDPVKQQETSLKGITSAQALANLRFAYVGESGQRNNFRSDGYFSVDDGLAKSFHTFREQQLRLSVEAFNVLNTNRFASVQTSGVNSNFGTYLNSTSAFQNGAVQSGTNSLLLQPRQMQFSGKYTF